MNDWFKRMPDKTFSAYSRTIGANSSEQFQLDSTRVIRSLLFSFTDVASTDYDNILIKLYAGSVDKTYFQGTIRDLLMVGFLQNTRNLIDGNNVKALLTFDYPDDNIMSPLVPYIEPITLSVENRTATQISMTLSMKGVSSSTIVNAIHNMVLNEKKVSPTEVQIKNIMKNIFKVRRFIGRLYDIASTTQTITIPATQGGSYDRIVPYLVNGDLDTLTVIGVEEMIEENKFEVLTDQAILESGVDPANSPSTKFALLSGLDASSQYSLNITATANTQARVITERVY